MPAKTSNKVVDMHLNSALPVLMVDTFNINLRQDNIVLIRLLAHLPEGLTEQARFMVDKEKLKNMLDLFSEVLEHYPIRKKK
jgi:hypothetical protein